METARKLVISEENQKLLTERRKIVWDYLKDENIYNTAYMGFYHAMNTTLIERIERENIKLLLKVKQLGLYDKEEAFIELYGWRTFKENKESVVEINMLEEIKQQHESNKTNLSLCGKKNSECFTNFNSFLVEMIAIWEGKKQIIGR